MLLIGLCGKMGSGKDYIASKYIIPYIENTLQLKTLQMSFADQLKVNIMTKENISYQDVYINKTNETRCLLQREGTEQGRNIYGADIWLRYLENWINVYQQRGIQAVVVPDVRFRNELDYIHKRGGFIIRVDAKTRNDMRLLNESKGDPKIYKRLALHQSECDLDALSNDKFDFILNNDVNDKPNIEEMLNIIRSI
jgi:hypothetical protein